MSGLQYCRLLARDGTPIVSRNPGDNYIVVREKSCQYRRQFISGGGRILRPLSRRLQEELEELLGLNKPKPEPKRRPKPEPVTVGRVDALVDKIIEGLERTERFVQASAIRAELGAREKRLEALRQEAERLERVRQFEEIERELEQAAIRTQQALAEQIALEAKEAAAEAAREEARLKVSLESEEDAKLALLLLAVDELKL